MVGHFAQPAAQQGFHDDGGNLQFGQPVIQVFARTALVLIVVPVAVVSLNLYKVPFVFVVMVQHPVKDSHIAVEREAQVPDSPCSPLFHQPVQQAVVEEALVQVVHTAATYRVQEQIVYIVRLHILQAVLEDLLSCLEAVLLGTEVRQLRSYEVLVPAVAALLQGDAQRLLALSPAVGWRRIEVVYTMIQCILTEAVHLFLVYHILVIYFLGRQAHPAVTQNTYFLLCLRVHPVGHLIRRNRTCMMPHIIYLSVTLGISCTTTCQSRSSSHSTRNLQEISSVIFFHFIKLKVES